MPLAISLLLIKIRCLLLLPLIVPKLKLIACKSEKKTVIRFGEFEAEGHSRAYQQGLRVLCCAVGGLDLLTCACVCARVCVRATPTVSAWGSFSIPS